MKRAFAAGAVLAVLAFVVLFLAYRETFLHVPAMHAALFFTAAYLIWDSDLQTTLKKLGVPGDLKRNAVYFLGGVAALVLATVALNILFHLTGIQDGSRVAERVEDLPFYILAFGILLAPFSEELFFRGLLVEKAGPFLASLVFALFHFAYGSVAEILGTFVIGLVLAFLYQRSGSLLPVIGVHMLFNLVSILFILWRGTSA